MNLDMDPGEMLTGIKKKRSDWRMANGGVSMPKVMLTQEQRQQAAWALDDQEIRMDIGAWKAATGKQLEDLAELVGMSKSTLYSRVKHPGDFSLDEVRRLYRVMDKILKARRCA